MQHMMDRIGKLEEYLKATPEDPFLLHALALEYIKKGDDGKARQLFESLLARNPDYVGSYYHLARLLERQEETELAVKTYEKGMEEAGKAGDDLSYRELKAALEELIF
jgi:tetratricopeptide (TPR) repeat protein